MLFINDCFPGSGRPKRLPPETLPSGRSAPWDAAPLEFLAQWACAFKPPAHLPLLSALLYLASSCLWARRERLEDGVRREGAGEGEWEQEEKVAAARCRAFRGRQRPRCNASDWLQPPGGWGQRPPGMYGGPRSSEPQVARYFVCANVVISRKKRFGFQ